MISKRSLRMDSSGIRKVFELADKIENPVNFSIGQPDFDVPDFLKEKAIEAIRKGFNRYSVTQGINELREKVLEHINVTRNRNFSMDEVIITSGTSGGLFLALISIIDPGDEIIFFDPYFVMYKHLVNLLDGKPVIVDTYPDFKIPEDRLRKAVTDRTKAIIINSPNNPTGYVCSKQDIDAVIRVAKEKNILLITDEIYDGFIYDGKFQSASSYYENILILGGFSKTYGMTGWRLGYALGNKELVSRMIILQQYSFVCAPTPFQFAAAAAFDTDTETFTENYRRKRDIVYEGLKDNFDIVKPGGAFYLFPKLKFGDVSEFVELAIREKVLIIPGTVFSEKNTNFRISFATSDEKIREGVEILNRTAKDYYLKVKG